MDQTAFESKIKALFQKVNSLVTDKILSKIPDPVIQAIYTGRKTFKKLGGLFLGYLSSLLILAAHYGPMAIGGVLAGAGIGLPFAIPAGISAFTTVTALFAPLGLLAPVIGGIAGVVTFFGVETIFTGGGFLGGVGLQMLIDKVGSWLGATSIPQSASQGLAQVAASAGNVIAPAVGLTLGGTLIATMLYSQVTSNAFIMEAGTGITSPHILVTKTVSFSGKIGEPINYQIKITAVDKDLSQVKIDDQPQAQCRGNPPPLSNRLFGPDSITKGNNLEKTYQIPTNDQFNDCLISNVVHVTAIVEGNAESSFAVGRVSIGNPPIVTPWGLPIRNSDNPHRGNGYTFGQAVTRPDGTTYIHQGIDVHSDTHNCPVVSTFPIDSTVFDVGYGINNGYYIILSVGQYQIFMGHLAQRPNFNLGNTVGPFAAVGIQGDTGSSIGEHVHYMVLENGSAVDPRRFGVPSPPW